MKEYVKPDLLIDLFEDFIEARADIMTASNEDDDTMWYKPDVEDD